MLVTVTEILDIQLMPLVFLHPVQCSVMRHKNQWDLSEHDNVMELADRLTFHMNSVMNDHQQLFHSCLIGDADGQWVCCCFGKKQLCYAFIKNREANMFYLNSTNKHVMPIMWTLRENLECSVEESVFGVLYLSAHLF